MSYLRVVPLACEQEGIGWGILCHGCFQCLAEGAVGVIGYDGALVINNLAYTAEAVGCVEIFVCGMIAVPLVKYLAVVGVDI